MKTKFFTALDLADEKSAWALYEQVRPLNPYFKVGLELYSATGPAFVRRLTADGAKVFLDLKLHDIPNTVASAVKVATHLGVNWLTLHLMGGSAMVKAAVAARDEAGSSLALLGVTVLTSMDDRDLRELGFAQTVAPTVMSLAKLGKQWGVDGIVCSSEELANVRRELSRDFLTVVPGIRPMDSASGDQKRVATPAQAAKAGADYLVIGRPIRDAENPRAVVEQVLSEL